MNNPSAMIKCSKPFVEGKTCCWERHGRHTLPRRPFHKYHDSGCLRRALAKAPNYNLSRAQVALCYSPKSLAKASLHSFSRTHSGKNEQSAPCSFPLAGQTLDAYLRRSFYSLYKRESRATLV
ncbi:hypothetical protein DdX_09497 [Ditylenchus destructor]|uniref:Uncharacterized protein n=1 Tax=Ditylenchus destructor TaxID=166010 RepID=A0AAD4MZX1_9BILA|nr:hypothetical protein DdX_09497 [Ditylenchus destructor]